MKPLEILVSEHGLIRQYLGVLNEALTKLERSESLPKEFFEQVVIFARDFVDKYHHVKEEHQMFTRIAEKKIGQLDAPIELLRNQHENGRRYISAIAEAIPGYLAGNNSLRDDILGNLAAFISMLRAHIHQEDHIFFPLVADTLTDAEQEDLLAEFIKADERVGKSFVTQSQERLLKIEAMLSLR